MAKPVAAVALNVDDGMGALDEGYPYRSDAMFRFVNLETIALVVMTGFSVA